MEHEPALALERVDATAAAPLSYGLFAMGRAFHAYCVALLAELGLHPGQELIIMHLLRTERSSAAEMVAPLGIDHSTATRSLARMEKAGLVERTASPTDRRKMVVQLTSAGLALRGPLEQLWATLDATAGARLNAHERTILIHLAEQVERSVVSARDIRRCGTLRDLE